MAVLIPKLAFPPTIIGGGDTPARFATVEQDSEDEIAACTYAVMATELDTRLEEPKYGVTDPTFEQGGMDLGEALLAINTWEPRAEVSTEQEILDLVSTVRVKVKPA